MDQARAGIDPRKTVWEGCARTVTGLYQIGQTEVPSRAYVSAFGFRDRTGKLSRCAIGREAAEAQPCVDGITGGNLILLDEPTNDLDVETLGSLENALLNFPAAPW